MGLTTTTEATRNVELFWHVRNILSKLHPGVLALVVGWWQNMVEARGRGGLTRAGLTAAALLYAARCCHMALDRPGTLLCIEARI